MFHSLEQAWPLAWLEPAEVLGGSLMDTASWENSVASFTVVGYDTLFC